jgi:hypothetical protein
MDKPYRRYELLLPLRFNDGTSVPEGLFVDTLLELEERFGAVSCETQHIRGQWNYRGQSFRDDLVRAFVDVPDTADHRQFFIELKERLKERFQQLDIWITTHPLEIL